MYQKISLATRMIYLVISIILFCIGLIFLMFFFLLLTIPFGLAIWAWSGIFLYLAAVGRPYADLRESLWGEGQTRRRSRWK